VPTLVIEFGGQRGKFTGQCHFALPQPLEFALHLFALLPHLQGLLLFRLQLGDVRRELFLECGQLGGLDLRGRTTRPPNGQPCAQQQAEYTDKRQRCQIHDASV